MGTDEFCHVHRYIPIEHREHQPDGFALQGFLANPGDGLEGILQGLAQLLRHGQGIPRGRKIIDHMCDSPLATIGSSYCTAFLSKEKRRL